MAQATVSGTTVIAPGHVAAIEAELTRLLRRATHARLSLPGPSGQSLERSAYAVLVALSESGPLRASDLAGGLGLDLSTVSRTVSTLTGLGLVGRATDPADRRACLLELTDEGRRIHAEARQRRHEAMNALLGGWPERDMATLARLLARLNQGLEQLTGPDGSLSANHAATGSHAAGGTAR